jgi:hypothetical protein
METLVEQRQTCSHERRVLRELMPDACDSVQCLTDRGNGMSPRFPFSWDVRGNSVSAHYYCARCRKNWTCWWSLNCVSMGTAE